MTTIAADQARNEFDELLDRAAAGEEFVIMRQGRAVARIGPAGADRSAQVASAIARIRELRKGNRLGPDLTLRGMIDEGRRL